MPFNAVAGADVNGDGLVSDFVPGTTRAMGNRDNATVLEAANAYRATLGLAPIPASQLDSNDYNAVDVRVNKSFALGGRRKIDLIAQVFNLLGRDNLAASGGAAGRRRCRRVDPERPVRRIWPHQSGVQPPAGRARIRVGW